ncbi:Tn3 family transposase [Streptomyces finlayi]|uniref:Tn3 family transposase n=1 Tax=Streptomyces finlayi TaxID=67296 RepID=UPI004046559B
MAIHSQLINCTASEVAAMIEGAMRPGTTMDVEANYTDSHGQSEFGFGITRLLNFDLLPRIKRINKVRLYRPVAGEPDACPQLTPAPTRPIRWEFIAQQYDQMIKYAHRDPDPHHVRRGDPAALHPQRLPSHLRGDAGGRPRAEGHLRGPLPAAAGPPAGDRAGLNVMEFQRRELRDRLRRGREIASKRRDEQEMFVLCLRILQSALVYVNTLMLQDILGEPEWAELLTPADRRGLTPAVLVPRTPVRRGQPRHGHSPQPCRGQTSGPRVPTDAADLQPSEHA